MENTSNLQQKDKKRIFLFLSGLFLGVAFSEIFHFLKDSSYYKCFEKEETWIGFLGVCVGVVSAFLFASYELIKETFKNKVIKIILLSSIGILSISFLIFCFYKTGYEPNCKEKVNTTPPLSNINKIQGQKSTKQEIPILKSKENFKKNKFDKTNNRDKPIQKQPIEIVKNKAKIILCYQEGGKYYYEISYINGNSIPDTVRPESLIRQPYLMKRSKNASYSQNDTLYKCYIPAGSIIEFNPLVFTRDAESGKTFKYEVTIIHK
jgi:hypothetical protein